MSFWFLGMACHLPGSFLSSVVAIIDAKSYDSAIKQNILCGGDSCSRATVIGACLGVLVLQGHICFSK